jgi:peptidoglycan/xylan/chitin deacetylase (PgdA/CDA1 family)
MQGSLSSNQFENLIKTIGIDNITPAKEWLTTHKGYCLSFDDGLINQYKVALPILEKYKITALWFLNSAPLVGEPILLEIYRYFRNEYFTSMDEFYEQFFKLAPKIEMPKDFLSEFKFYTIKDRMFRYLRKQKIFDDLMYELMNKKNFNPKDIIKDLWISAENLKELNEKDHIIGLHSHTHPIDISELSIEEQKYEYRINLRILSNIINKKIDIMSHPLNSYSNETLKILSDIGIKFGFRSNDIKKTYSNLELPRKDCMLLDVIKV